MIYSKTCEYAIRALTYLASEGLGRATGVLEIKKQTGVPPAYLAKIFQCLERAGMVSSKSGPHGGYALHADPSRLTLYRVVETLDNVSLSPLSNCVMGYAECSNKKPCAMHPIWEKARTEMNDFLKKETIADLVKLEKKGYKNQARRDRLSKRMRG